MHIAIKSKLVLLIVGGLMAMPIFAQKIADFNSHKISYQGRIGQTDSCAELYWTGSSISFNIKHTKNIRALLSNEKGNDYYYIIIDGNGDEAKKIKIDQEKKWYTIATNLTSASHHIEIFKITNTDFITTRFFGIEIDNEASLLRATKKPKRSIEFFGNSITCGHGVEDNSKDAGSPEFFNNYRAYGAITARYFNAQYHCTSKSGIGILVSWFAETMPDIYDRLNPKDANSKWNFKNYTPDIVVINLFQNDSWLTENPNHPQFKARFGSQKPTQNDIISAYQKMVMAIRSKYAKAHIICALGNMDATKPGSKWPGYIDAALAQLKDKKIVTHFFPYKNTPGHPNKAEQQTMANDLIAFIQKQKYWN